VVVVVVVVVVRATPRITSGRLTQNLGKYEESPHSREKTRIIEHVSTSTIHEKKEVISKTPPTRTVSRRK
jgi:hypothetical protein